VDIPQTQAALRHLFRVLAHEATHAVQVDFFEQGALESASKLSKTYDKTGNPNDYAAYISCEPEKYAHAVMIAADLCDEEIDAQLFSARAQSTWSYGYFSGRLNGASQAQEVLDELLALSCDAYKSVKGI
jgi:hypothetical protein